MQCLNDFFSTGTITNLLPSDPLGWELDILQRMDLNESKSSCISISSVR